MIVLPTPVTPIKTRIMLHAPAGPERCADHCPPSRSLSCGEFHLPQSRREQAQNDQSEQVSAGRDTEEARIAVCQLQNVACEEGEKRAADGSRHATDTD